jgi:DNA-binding NarL/FixJ family response regulator
MTKPRILLADDHTMVAEGLKRLLEGEFQLVGIAQDGRTLLDMLPQLNPDLLLLDVSMPLLNGFETANRAKKLRPDLLIVFISMHSDAEYVKHAFRSGASGYVLKRSAASELVQAIREVLAGRYYVTPLLRQEKEALLDSGQKPRQSGLTTRQREVLQLVAEGKTGKDIAHILHISLKTVEFHKACIMRELDLHTTAELTRYALEHGISGS